MKSIVTALTVVLLACGVSDGQEEPAAVSEHLKCFGPFIGNWQYEGPLREDLEGMAEKDAKLVFQGSYKRILNGSAVESNWSVEFEGGGRISGKDLYGWDAKEEKIVEGGMSSNGGINVGSVTHNKAAKSLTFNSKGVDGDGEKTSSKIVITKVDKDTVTWQAVERSGGSAEGPSPVYTFKRVKRQAKKQAK